MHHLKVFTFFKEISLVTFIITSSSLFAQKTLQYHNRNELGKNSIQDVSFSYTLSKGDTLIQDEYLSLLFSYYPDSISNIRKLRLNYKNGIPNGEFYLEKATFTTKNNFPSYRNFRVQQAIKGNSLFATGRYVNGVRTGTWTQYDVLIDDRKMDTLSSIYANFSKNGQWHGLFTIKDTNLQLNGHINDGTPDGNWEGSWNGKPVKLQFTGGMITHFSVGGKIIDFKVPTDGVFYVENMHEVFSQYVSIFPSTDNQFNEDVYQIATKLAASIRGFIPNKNLTEGKNKAFQFDAVQIGLLVSFLSDEDKTMLLSVTELYNQLSAEVQTLISEPTLLLSSSENAEIAHSMEKIKVISQGLEAFAPVFQIANSTMSSYVNWENVVRLATEKSNEILSEKISYNASLSAIENLQSHLTSLTTEYETNKKLVDKYLLEVQNSEELTRLRQEFVNLQLRTLEDEIELLNVPYYQKEYQDGFNHFKNLVVERFKVASENSNKEQMESLFNQGANLISLLQQTAEWVRLHDIIIERNKYMYLDANTFEERKEILYVQLYRAYERKIMPFVMGQLSYNFNNFNEFKASFDNISIVQQKMLEILDQDPKKINRKLKNRDSVEKVIEKMGLILN